MNPDLPVVYTAPLLRVFARFSLTPPPNLTPADPVEVRKLVAYLRLRNRHGGWTGPIQFCIDTGSDITKLSLEKARSEGWDLDVGEDCGYVEHTTAAGRGWVRVYRGSIGVRFRYPTEKNSPPDFVWKCPFIEGLSDETPPLLGLHDVLSFVRNRFDKTARPNAPNGAAIFERYDALSTK